MSSSTIVRNLTISGFKVYGADCDGTDFINTTILSSGIYKYQNSAVITGSLSQTIYLEGSVSGTRGGAKTVDTLSVMVDTLDASDRVEINGYLATRGVGSTGTTAGGYAINWAVWAPQSTNGSGGVTPSPNAYGNSPAYTVASGSGSSYSLSQVKLAGTYNTNNSLSVTEGTNNLIIEIWNAARTVKRATLTYYVVIVSSSTRLSSLIPVLSPNSLIPGYSYSPAFDSDYCSYNSQIYILNVNPESTSMTLTPTASVASSGSIIRITSPDGTVLAPLLSGQTSASFDIGDDNSVNVSVTAPDGTTVQQYVISIQSDVSGNDLGDVSLSYYSTVSTLTPFDQTGASNTSWLTSINPKGNNAATPTPVSNLALYTNFSYLNTIPNVSYGVSVTLSAADSGASVAVGDSAFVPLSGTFLVPYSSLVQGAQNIIVGKCKSSTGIIKLYNFNIWLAGSDVAPFVSGSLSNISFNSSQAILDPNNPFVATDTEVCSSLADVIASVTDLPTYTVYVTPTATAGTVDVTITLTYNDAGSRFSVYSGSAWVPVDIQPTPPLPQNTPTDNWTIGSQRSASVTITITNPVISTQVLVASHLPGTTAYYGYALNFFTPRKNLTNLTLSSYETNAPISLNPVFNPLVLSYNAYIGTAANPTNKVNLTSFFSAAPAGSVVDWSITSGTGTYASSQALTSGTQVTITLGSAIATSYTLYIRLWSAATSGTELAYYTLNLLNVDASLVLSGLKVYNQVARDPDTGVYPPVGAESTLSPIFSNSSPLEFVYNAPIVGATGSPPVTALYAAIQPTVLNPGVKTINISLNGVLDPVPVVSGSYYRFPMDAKEIVAVITITDNLSPSNSNSYTLFLYSTSANLSLSFASFSGILNSAFSPALPNGTTITGVITAPAGTAGLTVSCSNAAISTTRFTGIPQQAGTSMYLSTGLGFEPLTPDEPSSLITLTPNAAKSIPIWMYANNMTTTGFFNFSITQVPDTNSFLSSMILTNCTNFTFNPVTQTYNGIVLAAPNTSFSFTPTTASTNATMAYSFNGSPNAAVLSGVSVNLTSTNYLPNTNVLSIVVSPQAGPTRTYIFNIVRNVNFYLLNLRVYLDSVTAQATTATTASVVSINPSPFSPTFYTYSAEVGPSVDTAYVVLTKAPESSITMTNASLVGINTVGDFVYAVPVQVTTSPQNTLVYSINPSAITVAVGVQSSVYNLAIVRKYPVATAASISLARGGLTIPLRNQLGVATTFDPLVFTYTISPVNTGTVDVSIIGQGYNTYYLNGSPYYVPTGVIIDSTHPIVVGVVNNDGSSSTYQFSLL